MLLAKLENRWANDIDGSALAAQPGKSQGRPLKSPGSKPIAQSGLPSLRSPEGPCPSRPNLSPAPDDTGAFKEQFHAASCGSQCRVQRAFGWCLDAMRRLRMVRRVVATTSDPQSRK